MKTPSALLHFNATALPGDSLSAVSGPVGLSCAAGLALPFPGAS